MENSQQELTREQLEEQKTDIQRICEKMAEYVTFLKAKTKENIGKKPDVAMAVFDCFLLMYPDVTVKEEDRSYSVLTLMDLCGRLSNNLIDKMRGYLFNLEDSFKKAIHDSQIQAELEVDNFLDEEKLIMSEEDKMGMVVFFIENAIE